MACPEVVVSVVAPSVVARLQEASHMESIRHWIGGRAVAGVSGRTAPVYDPARGAPVAEVPLASAA